MKAVEAFTTLKCTCKKFRFQKTFLQSSLKQTLNIIAAVVTFTSHQVNANSRP